MRGAYIFAEAEGDSGGNAEGTEARWSAETDQAPNEGGGERGGEGPSAKDAALLRDGEEVDEERDRCRLRPLPPENDTPVPLPPIAFAGSRPRGGRFPLARALRSEEPEGDNKGKWQLPPRGFSPSAASAPLQRSASSASLEPARAARLQSRWSSSESVGGDAGEGMQVRRLWGDEGESGGRGGEGEDTGPKPESLTTGEMERAARRLNLEGREERANEEDVCGG